MIVPFHVSLMKLRKDSAIFLSLCQITGIAWEEDLHIVQLHYLFDFSVFTSQSIYTQQGFETHLCHCDAQHIKLILICVQGTCISNLQHLLNELQRQTSNAIALPQCWGEDFITMTGLCYLTERNNHAWHLCMG